MTRVLDKNRILLLATVLAVVAGLGCSTDSPTAPTQTPAPPGGGPPSAVWNITVQVTPDEVAQGSTEPARVAVRVRNAADGAPPPQGTTIVVSTTLGEFVSLGSGLNSIALSTTNGRAETLFFPGGVEGSAVITAQLEASAGQVAVRIREGIVAAFEWVNGGPGAGGSENLSVQFVNRSSGDPRRYFWDFGDGSSSREENPLHIYDTPGDYLVSLRIEKGTFSDENDQILLVREPIFIEEITPNTGPPGTRATIRGQGFLQPLRVVIGGFTAEVTFVSGARNSIGVIIPFFSSDFFDTVPCTTLDDMGMEVEGEQRIETPADVTVSTIGSTAGGGTDTLPASFFVLPEDDDCEIPPSGTGSGSGSLTAGISATCTSGTSTCNFTDASAGTPVSWSWFFGDGFAGSGPSVNHTYGLPGTYTVTLTVSDASGASSTTTTMVTVPAP